MRQDSNSLVQLEAEYKYQLLNYHSEGYDLPKAERRKQRKNLERQYKPRLSFTHISSAFSSYLYTNGLKQYSIPELEEFIESL